MTVQLPASHHVNERVKRELNTEGILFNGFTAKEKKRIDRRKADDLQEITHVKSKTKSMLDVILTYKVGRRIIVKASAYYK